MKKGLEILTAEELERLHIALHIAKNDITNYHLICYLEEFNGRVEEELTLRNK